MGSKCKGLKVVVEEGVEAEVEVMATVAKRLEVLIKGGWMLFKVGELMLLVIERVLEVLPDDGLVVLLGAFKVATYWLII